jgi:hypothetical protein
MAHGIESLATFSSLCSMDSNRGGHSDNCKFWLLDLGRLAPSTPAVHTERDRERERERETIARTGPIQDKHTIRTMCWSLCSFESFLQLEKWESYRFNLLPSPFECCFRAVF